MTNEKEKAGILGLATYLPQAYRDDDYISSQSETSAEVIRTKLGWY